MRASHDLEEIACPSDSFLFLSGCRTKNRTGNSGKTGRIHSNEN